MLGYDLNESPFVNIVGKEPWGSIINPSSGITNSRLKAGLGSHCEVRDRYLSLFRALTRDQTFVGEMINAVSPPLVSERVLYNDFCLPN